MRRRLEGARLDDVAAHGEKRLVNSLNDVGTREHEVIVAPLQRFSTEIIGGEMMSLDVRAHRAVEHEDLFAERVEFDERVERLVEDIKSSQRAEGVVEIRLPGEASERRRAETLARGTLELEDATWEFLHE